MKWWSSFPPGGVQLREAVAGCGLFITRDPETWTWGLENLGRHCAEAWRDDLLAEDRAWAPWKTEGADEAHPPDAGAARRLGRRV